jgi:hypothetical protein
MRQFSSGPEQQHVTGGRWWPDAALSDHRQRYRIKSYSGAPRPMKMGNIASPWRYDVGTHVTPQEPRLRRLAIWRSAWITTAAGIGAYAELLGDQPRQRQDLISRKFVPI